VRTRRTRGERDHLSDQRLRLIQGYMGEPGSMNGGLEPSVKGDIQDGHAPSPVWVEGRSLPLPAALAPSLSRAGRYARLRHVRRRALAPCLVIALGSAVGWLAALGH
jgi:hypothetical protein